MNLFDEILRGQGGGGGKIKPEQLPDGYPYETVGLVEIIPEMSVTVMSMGVGMSMGQVPTPPEIASYEGKTVTVKLNGIEYECELNSFNDALVCGNLSFAGLESGKEYPFALSFQPENGFGGIVTQDEVETDYTFSLSGEGTVAVPMAEKFLPAGIGGGDMLSVAIVYDGSSYTCNKTYEEVDNALNNNIPIYAIYAEYTSGRRRQCLYREVRHGSSGRILFVGNEYDVDLDLYTNNEVHPEELES